MQIGIANGIPLNDVITGDDLVPAYDQSTGTEGYVNLTTAVQKAFSGSGAGTANGVLYLNGSKVATSGSALTFDSGTGIFQVNQGAGLYGIRAASSSGSSPYVAVLSGDGYRFGFNTGSAGGPADFKAFDGQPISWTIGGEQMRLTSTGLGIGTSSPQAKLHVLDMIKVSSADQSNGKIALGDGGTTQFGVGFARWNGSGESFGAGGIGYFSQGAGNVGGHYWYTGDAAVGSQTRRMTLDSSGNLGLGVTPSAWGSPGNISLPSGGVIHTTGADFYTGSNLYFSSGWKYASTGAATYHRQNAGTHSWYTAPSGTAGQPISFTQAMTLDASGNLLVGTTAIEGQGGVSVLPNSSQGATRIAWNRVGTTNTTYALDFKDNSVTVGSVSYTNTATAYNTASDYRLKLDQKPLTNSGAFIDALKPKTWNWKADGSKGVGFIAHEVQEVSPTSVVGEKDAMRVEQYEVSPAVPATYDEQGNELTPAVEAIMGEREVPAYQAMEYGSAEFIANIVAELQSLRKRVAALEA